MAKIRPKLYLNGSPQTTEEGALMFARNMKIDDDGNLVSDYGASVIDANDTRPEHRALSTYNIIGHIVGIDNKVYLFTDNDIILEYDEVSKTITKTIDGYWNYGGGKINGCVSTNISGEKILTIGEHFDDSFGKVPLKHINLSGNNYEVLDESLYCQAPVIPITNLVLDTTYVKTIPNGVYVFFIRYKIRKDVYTPWYLCSSPIFAGSSEKISTIQGGLKYIDLHKDSAKSFVFNVNHIIDTNISYYKEFQIGFILTHDESTNARIWKSFDINTTKIYFDYENVKDANIDDLLAVTYELYSVGNIANFKNKLYISNYVESNFNNEEELSELASNIQLSTIHYNDSSIDINYKNFKFNGLSLNFDYTKGYFDRGNYTAAQLLGNVFDDNFTINLNKLAKLNTIEKENILQFDIRWKAGVDPDIVFIYNIYNKLFGNSVFGNSYDVNYANVYNIFDYSHKYGDLYILTSKNGGVEAHPFYSNGLTFAYTCLPESDISEVYPEDTKSGVFFCNRNSKRYKATGQSSSPTGWPDKNKGFDTFARSAVEENIEKEILDKNIFGIAYVEISYGAKVYRINRYINGKQQNDDFLDRINRDNYAGYSIDLDTITFANFSLSEPSGVLSDRIKSHILGIIETYFIGFTEDAVPVLDLSSVTGDSEATSVPVNAINVVLKTFEFNVDSEELDNDDNNYAKRFKISLKTTDYSCSCNFFAKNTIYTVIDELLPTTQASTLMPCSKYKVYAHFVDNSGIISNGILLSHVGVNGIIETQHTTAYDELIKLQYKYIGETNGNYPAFFISLINVGDLVAECFGYTKKGNTNIVNCLEADTLLYNINDNISVYAATDDYGLELITTNAVYYSSGSSYPILAFGNCGYIAWNDSDEEQHQCDLTTATIFIKIIRDNSSENNNQLIKASNYIPLREEEYFIDLPGGYYGSYLCSVKKPDFAMSSRCYVSGNDIYGIDRSVSLALTEFKSYVQIQNSVTYFIRSNFNLNYLSLTEDVPDKIFSIGSSASGVKEVAKVINSATLSYIYELKSMYKDFQNKVFRIIDTDYKTEFDNTIRVSNVLSDETFNNSVFRFEAENYYNVPTDRGIIVNLFSIGNNIYVHTKGSLYKFDANQTIAASGTDIKLQESEPFDSGINQIIDSQYGYGGINNKEAGCITFDSYFFYDKFSNHIFAYAGNGQIQLIDASIYKLLKYYSPEYCYTLHDDVNHRVLFNFKNKNNENLFTISFNYKSRSFVSIHDIDLVDSFAGRIKAYSYKRDMSILFESPDIITLEMIDEDLKLYNVYGLATIASIINMDEVQLSPFNIAVIMFPKNNIRENIDNIKFIGEVINPFIEEESIEHESIDEEPWSTYWSEIKVPVHNNVENPVESLKIITDTCISNTVTGTVNDVNRPETLKNREVIPNGLTDYKGFKHAIDAWNANYFRNIKNGINIYGYPNQPRAEQPINSDNNSLVYGKYYVLIFNFIKTKRIKFEEIFINSEKY